MKMWIPSLLMKEEGLKLPVPWYPTLIWYLTWMSNSLLLVKTWRLVYGKEYQKSYCVYCYSLLFLLGIQMASLYSSFSWPCMDEFHIFTFWILLNINCNSNLSVTVQQQCFSRVCTMSLCCKFLIYFLYFSNSLCPSSQWQHIYSKQTSVLMPGRQIGLIWKRMWALIGINLHALMSEPHSSCVCCLSMNLGCLWESRIKWLLSLCSFWLA